MIVLGLDRRRQRQNFNFRSYHVRVKPNRNRSHYFGPLPVVMSSKLLIEMVVLVPPLLRLGIFYFYIILFRIGSSIRNRPRR